jgi:hypothetical protein
MRGVAGCTGGQLPTVAYRQPAGKLKPKIPESAPPARPTGAGALENLKKQLIML